MPSYSQQIHTYLRHTWMEDYKQFKDVKSHHVAEALQPYQTFYDELIPNDQLRNPYYTFIHRERIIYQMYMNDRIMVFKFDSRDDSDSEESSDDDESDSMYSESPLESDEEPDDFINGMKILDEYDFREQLQANEFVGGYWEPKLHWVLTKPNLQKVLQNAS